MTTMELNKPQSKTIPDYIFMILIGLAWGALGGFMNVPFSGIFGAIVLATIFGAYSRILDHNRGILNSLATGGVLGALIGALTWFIGGTINDAFSGALFGLIRGAVVGGLIGFITRAESDEKDSLGNKVFLFIGSGFLGTVLGGVVGVTSGAILGVIGGGFTSAIRGTIVGAIVGGYLGSYYKETRWVAISGTIASIVVALSAIVGGASAGVIMGAISGMVVPMLFVAAIGAVGGLTSRGLKAMVVEALEAPTEMLEQGAVPFLMPAVIIGLVVGTAAAEASGLVALSVCLAIVGVAFGVMNEAALGNGVQFTVTSVIQIAMMGTDYLPLGYILHKITDADRQKVWRGAGLGAGLGLVAGTASAFACQYLINLLLTYLK